MTPEKLIEEYKLRIYNYDVLIEHTKQRLAHLKKHGPEKECAECCNEIRSLQDSRQICVQIIKGAENQEDVKA